jgi:hypothetical protein
VIGPTVSEYYGLIRLPDRLRHPYLMFRFRLPVSRSFQGLPSSRHFSPHMPRSSWTPADPPKPHHSGFFVLASSSLTLLPSALQCFHCYAITRLYQASGSTVSLVAYVVLCVRFNYFVRPFFYSSLLHNCNTRYGWLVRLCPIGSFTL